MSSDSNKTKYDVIIIGAGPAGYTAGIYSARAGHNTLILSGILPGGQLVNTTEVENYPGFEKGIMGPDLMIEMRKQTERMGATIIDDEASKVDFKKKPFKVFDVVADAIRVVRNEEAQNLHRYFHFGENIFCLGCEGELRQTGGIEALVAANADSINQESNADKD